MKHFKDQNFEGKKVLVRVDFNVPLNKETKLVEDDTRIKAAVPTIQKILNDGGAVILMSHLGRPNGEVNPAMSLKFTIPTLEKLLGKEVIFSNDSVGEDAIEKAKSLKSGQVLMLENLRFHKEEEDGDKEFAHQLSNLGDVYVNDAFGTAHRAHASTSIIASFAKEKMFGFVMEGEVSSIEKVLLKAEKPFTAIIGGSKVSDKVGVIENLMDRADHIIIGGAMAYTFKKALGGEVGKSRIEEDKLELAKRITEIAKEKGVQLHLPEDSLCAIDFSENSDSIMMDSDNISNDRMGLDIGSKAINDFRKVILQSKTILWNGPMGVFEWDKFAEGTKQVALSLAKATKESGAFTLIGGGDSVSAINKFNLQDEVSYISTGGGAMLECLEGKILPGVAAIAL